MAYDPEYHKQYNQQNRARKIELATAWQQNNPDRHNLHVANYAKSHPEIARKARHKYLEKNKGTLGYVQRSMLVRARSRAKQQECAFTITLDDILRVWPEHNLCPVFGTELDLSGNNIQQCASLDKIIPELGYIPNNIVVVSYRANSLKKDSTLAELTQLVEYYTRLINQKQEINK
jgi:hypothetical protein